MVQITTDLGTITVELNEGKAPQTTKNFLFYTDKKFYDDTVFHRVIPGFMIQGGGFTKDLMPKPVDAPIPNEANNGLKNVRGSIAMARSMDPKSATSQFYINLKDNAALDYTGPTPQGWGYAVFGKVTGGMDVVDKIAAQKTGTKNGHNDVPVDLKAVTIISVKRMS
ncbi:MAG TPA: peptidylprolyl isomerase [Gammaproteobacteria bacterium]|nr:peptidylprolyl isomerase [Gammaproteobacteria bacterium]